MLRTNSTFRRGSMKKLLSLFVLINLIITLVSCSTQTDIEISISSSTKFSDSEITSAIDCAKKKFKDFKGCTLTRIWYDEEKSNILIPGYLSSGKGSINNVTEDNVIILLSEFDVDSSGGDGSMNPNYTYTDWNWIVIRDSKTDDWRVDDWGY